MKKLLTVLAAVTLLTTLTGCYNQMQSPGGRENAHKRCVAAQGKWEETPNAWRCNG